MRVVSDFREAMWGVLQQGISTLDVDFVAYAERALRAAPVGASTPAFERALRGGGTTAPDASRRAVVARARDERRSTDVTMDQARVVVIGGGITGCSVAYHLAEAGWTDVLLVEKAQLTAGSTCQAAGLVTAFNPSSTMMRFRRYSIELYERLGVFERSGSLRLASSAEQLARARADRQPGPRHRARRRGHLGRRGARA